MTTSSMRRARRRTWWRWLELEPFDVLVMVCAVLVLPAWIMFGLSAVLAFVVYAVGVL